MHHALLDERGVRVGGRPTRLYATALVHGEVQVGEKLLAFPEAAIFFGYGLLYFYDEIRRFEDLLGGMGDVGSDRGVLLVVETRTLTGARLYDQLVAVVYQLRDPVWLHRNSAFLCFDLFRYADDRRHSRSPFLDALSSARNFCTLQWYRRKREDIKKEQ